MRKVILKKNNILIIIILIISNCAERGGLKLKKVTQRQRNVDECQGTLKGGRERSKNLPKDE